MVIAVSTSDEMRFVCASERDLPKEEQTVWLLRHLTAKELAKLQDGPSLQQETGAINMTMGSMLHSALRAALVGWENFVDGDGQEVENDTERLSHLGRNTMMVREKLLDRIPRAVRDEIGQAVLDGSALTEEDKGN